MKSETAFSRKDAICSALAVAIVLIGTATGSAMALLVMSALGLSLMAILYRKQFGGLFTTAVTAAIVAVAVVLVVMATQ